MDDIDRAQQWQAQLNRTAILNHRAATPSEPPLVADGVRVCRDCLEVIPWARLRISQDIVRCVDCQTAREKTPPGGQ
ncbi:MAG TPA: TraR/DksA family transcriptional regulator [Kiloniellaceae bacterium]|nr:TraR/DksA family transcriptional regulator [Kiloniellaceae bacterium]